MFYLGSTVPCKVVSTLEIHLSQVGGGRWSVRGSCESAA